MAVPQTSPVQDSSFEAEQAPPARPSPLGAEEVFARIKPGAFGLLRRYSIPEDHFEDILQDALLIYILRQPAVDKPEQWLLGTLRNRCLMYWRDRERRGGVVVDSTLIDRAADPRLSHQERVSLMNDLETALARLPAQTRRVIETRFLQGLSPAETARHLGYRESGIYKIIERGKKALAREMAKEGYGEMISWTA